MSRARLLAILVIAIVLAGCTPTKSEDSVLPPTGGGPPLRYVAIGASESVGIGADVPLREAWTRLLWTRAMPPRTTFINLAVPGSNTVEAVDNQLPQVGVGVEVATVWLNVNDIIDGVPVAEYEQQLRTIIDGLKTAGAKQILVANTPPLQDLPAYKSLGSGDNTVGRNSPFFGRPVPSSSDVADEVDEYNRAIADVVAATGSTLIDLYGSTVAARDAGRQPALVSSDGFHPSSVGHEEVARQFAAAVKPIS